MIRFYGKNALSFSIFIICFLSVAPAYAYMGPGGAVSSVGALLALIGAVVVAVVGFLWFPLKRMLAKKKQADLQQLNSSDLESTDENKIDSDDKLKNASSILKDENKA